MQYNYDTVDRITSATDAIGRLRDVEFDANGATPENRTDYTYDAVGRLIGLWAPNYDFVSFTYDARGRLTQKGK